jgi:hypothetical protein
MKVKSCYFATNGQTMVFDEEGKQIPELQKLGFILDIADELKKYCDENTEFKFVHFGTNGHTEAMNCEFSWWFKKKKDKK